MSGLCIIIIENHVIISSLKYISRNYIYFLYIYLLLGGYINCLKLLSYISFKVLSINIFKQKHLLFFTTLSNRNIFLNSPIYEILLWLILIGLLF